MRENEVKPNDVIFGTLITRATVCGALDKAKYWLEEMRKVGLTPDKLLLAALIKCAQKHGDKESVSSWSEEQKTADA